MIHGHVFKRRRATRIKAALMLATALVLLMPKLEDFQLPDLGPLGALFITAVQAGAS